MKNKLLGGYEWFLDNDDYWFLLADAPAICRMDKNHNVIFLKKISANICSREFAAYHKCFKIDRFVYCLPDLANSIIRYDTDNDIFAILNLNGAGRILDYHIKNKNLYLYASSPRRMIIIDINDFRIEREIYASESNTNNYLLGMSAYKDGAWCATGTQKVIDYYNFKTNVFEKKMIDINEPVVGSDLYNNQLLIYGLKGIVYHFEVNDDKLKIIDKINTANQFQFDWDVQLLNKSVFYNNKIFIISWACNYLTCYNLANQKIEYIDVEAKTETYNPNKPGNLFFDYLFIKEKNKLITRNIYTNVKYEIDLKTFQKSEFEIQFTDNDVRKVYKGITMDEGIMRLDEFIRMI